MYGKIIIRCHISLDCHNNEMHSEMPLVLHSVCGGSMLSFAVKAAERLVRPVVITADGSGSIGEHLMKAAEFIHCLMKVFQLIHICKL